MMGKMVVGLRYVNGSFSGGRDGHLKWGKTLNQAV